MIYEYKMSQSDSKSEQKKPSSAYIHFCNAQRAAVKAEDSQRKPKDVLKRLGELWQELKDKGGDEYNKYVKMQEDEKARYVENKPVQDGAAVAKPSK